MANKVNNSKKSSIIKKNKKDNNGRIVFLLFAVIMFIVILISSVFGDVMLTRSNKKMTVELETKYNELLEEENSLNSEVLKLQDPDYVARYAREKYLYTKEGEKILTIIDEKVKEDNDE